MEVFQLRGVRAWRDSIILQTGRAGRYRLHGWCLFLTLGTTGLLGGARGKWVWGTDSKPIILACILGDLAYIKPIRFVFIDL